MDLPARHLLLYAAIVYLAGLLYTGCSPKPPNAAATWRASAENGDKPGIGIELIREANGISGWLYILDPNKPHDFSAGSRHRMEIQKATDREIRFAVQLLPTRRDEMVLLLSLPLAGKAVFAVLRTQDGTGEPRTYEFVKTE